MNILYQVTRSNASTILNKVMEFLFSEILFAQKVKSLVLDNHFISRTRAGDYTRRYRGIAIKILNNLLI